MNLEQHEEMIRAMIKHLAREGLAEFDLEGDRFRLTRLGADNLDRVREICNLHEQFINNA
jgi:hypothetical protein